MSKDNAAAGPESPSPAPVSPAQRGREFLLVNLGLLFTAAGIVLFKAPNGFAIGGVSGLSIILNHLFRSVDIGLFMLLINVVLNIFGFFLLGADFGIKTVYSSFALSFFVWGGERLIPLAKPMTGDPMLELMFAIILPAVGSALVFNQNASTGGTDIIARALSKHTHLHVGKTLLIADILIAASAIWALSVRQGLYSVLGVVCKGFLIDVVIESMNISKKMEITTADPAPIERYILSDLKRGASVMSAQGAYTGKTHTVLTVVLSRAQAIKLRSFVHRQDPNAFIIITNTSEIIGKGFRNTNDL
jgi:uncharacterized membrane-anchored protein YitT (DUF2179 family)